MKARVYLETSFVSYLVARPSRDLIVAAHQQITQTWWEKRRNDFELFVSQLVVQEAGGGDVQAAKKRLDVIDDLPLLELNQQALLLSTSLLEGGSLPEKAVEDALHIAVATVHKMDYLLTWNCKHIANAETRGVIANICQSKGFVVPVICTPEELLEVHYGVER